MARDAVGEVGGEVSLYRHCEERSDEAIQLLPFLGEAGLLRGACHRARVRATRWLAMTVCYLAAILGAVFPSAAAIAEISGFMK